MLVFSQLFSLLLLKKRNTQLSNSGGEANNNQASNKSFVDCRKKHKTQFEPKMVDGENAIKV